MSVDSFASRFGWPQELAAALFAAAVYVASLVVLRLGKNRVFGRSTPHDIVLGFIIGSMFSRAINGTAELLPTVLAGVTLVLLHRLFDIVIFHSAKADTAMNGRHLHLVVEGEAQEEVLRKQKLSDRDLYESLRLEGKVNDVHDVALACLERNGKISVQPRKKPRVVEVSVEENVQTVRIELS